jgi:hypothetical protein
MHQHVVAAFDLWQQRSRHVWQLDLSLLTGIGVELEVSPAADARAEAARTGLRSPKSPPQT